MALLLSRRVNASVLFTHMMILLQQGLELTRRLRDQGLYSYNLLNMLLHNLVYHKMCTTTKRQRSHNTKDLQQTLLLRRHLLPLRFRLAQYRHRSARADLPIAATVLERRADDDAEIASSADI